MHDSLRRAQRTAERAFVVIEKLIEGTAGIAPRQANELATFLSAFATRLRKEVTTVSSQGFDVRIGEVVAFEFEVDRAVRFVEDAFLQPRTSGDEQRALGAADWMCVDGFRALVGDEHDCPVGPLIAVEPNRSPVIWSEEQSLPIPSLFTRQPQVFQRRKRGETSARKLGGFPVICLPGNLTGSPGDFVLLSHEVGHAVDSVNGYSKRIVESLEGVDFRSYWRAWMREIVADAVGILLSGEGFAVSFYSFTEHLGLPEGLTSASSYPGYSLRLQMLLGMLEKLGSPNLLKIRETIEGVGSEKVVGEEWPAVAQVFDQHVLPIIEKVVFQGKMKKLWVDRQASIWRFAATGLPLLKDSNDEYTQFDFPDLFSLISIMRYLDPERTDLNELFWQIYKEVFDPKRPAWMTSDSQWKFNERELPSLRATIVSEAGVKVPPHELLRDHDAITFVAATNGQLAKSLKKAFAARQENSWSCLEFFFASDDLLKGIERDDLESLDAKIDEKKKAKKALLALLVEGKVAKSYCFREFDGPLVFGAFFDAEEPGGRIHVSAQLPGINIRHCPASDHVWTDTEATPTYQAYLGSLGTLRERSKLLLQA